MALSDERNIPYFVGVVMSEYDRKVAQATEELAKELQYKRASGVAWSQLEIEYDLSRKTILRIFKRFDMQDMVLPPEEMWDRPCLKCRKPILRPKGQWLCMKCKYSNVETASGLSSSFLGLV